MSPGDDGLGRPIAQPMGSWSWPPDLLSHGNWHRLQALGLKSITIQDEFYILELPREWTAAERKYALIIRDPLTHRYDKKLLEWLRDQSNERLTEEVKNLDQELEKKWSFSIDIPRVVMDNLQEALSRVERGQIIRPWRPIFAKPQAVRDLRKAFPHLIKNQKTGAIIQTGYETGLIFCPSPLIPIAIDPTMLTLHDADMVMKAVWNMVKPDIKKSRGENRQGWTPISPRGEPEALARVLRCRPENFEKYLQWYDLRTAGLPFRLIAYYESTIIDPKRRMEILENVIRARKNPKVRKEVESESAVKKGVSLIMFAIHREKAPSDQDKILLFGDFNCPDHKDNECSFDCKYLIDWLGRFGKQFKDSSLREVLVFDIAKFKDQEE